MWLFLFVLSLLIADAYPNEKIQAYAINLEQINRYLIFSYRGTTREKEQDKWRFMPADSNFNHRQYNEYASTIGFSLKGRSLYVITRTCICVFLYENKNNIIFCT